MGGRDWEKKEWEMDDGEWEMDDGEWRVGEFIGLHACGFGGWRRLWVGGSEEVWGAVLEGHVCSLGKMFVC